MVTTRSRLNVLAASAVLLGSLHWGGALAQPPGRGGPPAASPPRKVYIGVRAEDSTSVAARKLGVRGAAGAAITGVVADGPGAKAGLRPGDLVVEFGGSEILRFEDLRAAVERSPIGSRQRVIYVRGDRRYSTTITMGSQPQTAPGAGSSQPGTPGQSPSYLQVAGGYRFPVPRGWKVIHPQQQDLPPERRYDVVEAPDASYRVFCHQASWPAGQAEQTLDQFVGEGLRKHPEGRSDRFSLKGAPAARVAILPPKDKVVMHYISFVHKGRRYLMVATAPGVSDLERLPSPLAQILDTVEFLSSDVAGRPGPVSPIPPATEPQPPVPGTSPIPETPPYEPPPGWLKETAGNVTLFVPEPWEPVPFLASDEGRWFKGNEDSPDATFAVIRDRGLDDLVREMTVQRRTQTTIAGQPADSCIGTIQGEGRQGKRMVIVPRQQGAGLAPVAFECFAKEDAWAAAEPVFQKILGSVRISAGSAAKPR